MEFLDAAEEELLAAADWYEEQQEGLGARFLAEVESASAVVTEHPGIGALWTYSKVPEDVRRFSIRTFPYHLIYVETPRLVVVAVAHMKRRPGYWQHRLQEL